MKASTSTSWRNRGEQFVIFQPRHNTIKPSEWTIALFVVHKILRVFQRKRGQNKGGDGGGDAGREQRTRPARDVHSWQDMELPDQLSEDKMPPSKVDETRKSSLLKDGFARLGRVFTGRRGAMSPPPVHAATV
jgi:hypothetical protein